MNFLNVNDIKLTINNCLVISIKIQISGNHYKIRLENMTSYLTTSNDMILLRQSDFITWMGKAKSIRKIILIQVYAKGRNTLSKYSFYQYQNC